MRVCACVCVWMEMGWPENENVQIDVFHLSPKCLPLLLLLCSQNTFISQSHPVLISQNTPHKRVKPNPYMELTHFNAQIRITLEKLPQTWAHTHTHALIWYTFHHQTQAINFYELSDLPEIKMYERCVEEYRVCDVRIYWLPTQQIVRTLSLSLSHTHIIAVHTAAAQTLTHKHTKNTHNMAMIRCFMNCFALLGSALGEERKKIFSNRSFTQALNLFFCFPSSLFFFRSLFLDCSRSWQAIQMPSLPGILLWMG